MYSNAPRYTRVYLGIWEDMLLRMLKYIHMTSHVAVLANYRSLSTLVVTSMDGTNKRHSPRRYRFDLFCSRD